MKAPAEGGEIVAALMTNKTKRVIVGIALAASVLVVGATGVAWAHSGDMANCPHHSQEG